MKKSVNHHWLGGLEPDPDKYFGFVYRIDCLETGHGYIGKRQYWTAKRGAKLCKSKVADRGSPRWKESCWVEADWNYYKGSSTYLEKFMKDNPSYTFTYTILKNCRSRGILLYSEAEEQWKCEVLVARLPDGKHKFFNHQIGGIRFRPKLSHTEESREKMSAAQKGRVITDEHRAKISLSWRARTVSDETKQKMRGNTNALGHKVSSETKRMLSELSKGKVHSAETLDKLRVISSDPTLYVFYNKNTKEEFVGTRVALCRQYSLDCSALTKVIKGVRKSTFGWTLRGVDEIN